MPEMKRWFNDIPDVMWTVVVSGVACFVVTPIALYNMRKRSPHRKQFRDDYTIIRDTELNVKTLTSYNPEELEAARKRTGLYMGNNK